MFAVRYDLRCPSISPSSHGELYATALEQCRFVDEHGFGSITVSEHHGVDDGYLPSPTLLASAIAACTSRSFINISALLAPLHDPLHLAEDLAVLDHISQGRASVTLGLGYRPEEYDQFGLEWKKRGRTLDHIIETLLQAWTGEPFEYEGRTVRVTPKPFTRPHPMIFVGGSSEAGAKRAARFGLPFFPTAGDEHLAALYQSELERLGKGPGFCLLPSGPAFVYVAEDPDKAWAEVGDYIFYEARVYSSWQPEGQHTHVTDKSATVDDLRAAGNYLILTPEECRARHEAGETLILHPLIGGTPPDLSWPSLQLIADKVLV